MMQVLFTADEMKQAVADPVVPLDEKLLDITTLLIQERMDVFSLDDLVIEGDRELKRLVEAKAAGKPVPKLKMEAPAPATTDLMAALRESVSKAPPKRKKVAA